MQEYFKNNGSELDHNNTIEITSEINNFERFNFKITEDVINYSKYPIDPIIEGEPEEAIGKLIKVFELMRKKGVPLETAEEERLQIICVGDVISHIVAESPLNKYLKLAIVDNKSHGKPCKRDKKKLVKGFDETLYIDVPSGVIPGKCFRVFEQCINSSKKSCVIVKGEEDLLVLPAGLVANSENTFVLYGQAEQMIDNKIIPPGIVFVHVTNKRKKELLKVLSLFKRELI
ncbi:MAG: DUF359 domain-containing protein [Promethearchaeota archaeon]